MSRTPVGVEKVSTRTAKIAMPLKQVVRRWGGGGAWNGTEKGGGGVQT